MQAWLRDARVAGDREAPGRGPRGCSTLLATASSESSGQSSWHSESPWQSQAPGRGWATFASFRCHPAPPEPSVMDATCPQAFPSHCPLP